MRSWRTHLAVLLGFAVLGLLLRWLLPAPMPRLPAPLPDRTIAESRPELRPAAPTPTPVSRQVPPEALAEAAQAVAEARGLGWIRCELGGASLDPGLVSGAFERAEISGSTLVAEVRTPSGHTTVHARLTAADRTSPEALVGAMLQNERNPLFAIDWNGAEQGQEGRCEVRALERITLRGRIVAADGSPFPGRVSLHGCGGLTGPIEQGRFETTWFAGQPCTLVATVIAGDLRAAGPGVTVISDSDRDGIEVLAPEALVGPTERLRQRQEESRVRLEELGELVDALERAHARDGLSPEAKAQILGRLEATDREIARLKELVERVLPEGEEDQEGGSPSVEDTDVPDIVWPEPSGG